MVKVEIDLVELLNTCFVIMPFSPTFQTQYEKVIKPAIEKVKLTAVRADDLYSKPHIMADIWKSIKSARVVLAGLSGKNPNVLYELGLAYLSGKWRVCMNYNKYGEGFPELIISIAMVIFSIIAIRVNRYKE